MGEGGGRLPGLSGAEGGGEPVAGDGIVPAPGQFDAARPRDRCRHPNAVWGLLHLVPQEMLPVGFKSQKGQSICLDVRNYGLI